MAVRYTRSLTVAKVPVKKSSISRLIAAALSLSLALGLPMPRAQGQANAAAESKPAIVVTAAECSM